MSQEAHTTKVTSPILLGKPAPIKKKAAKKKATKKKAAAPKTNWAPTAAAMILVILQIIHKLADLEFFIYKKYMIYMNVHLYDYEQVELAKEIDSETIQQRVFGRSKVRMAGRHQAGI